MKFKFTALFSICSLFSSLLSIKVYLLWIKSSLPSAPTALFHGFCSKNVPSEVSILSCYLYYLNLCSHVYMCCLSQHTQLLPFQLKQCNQDDSDPCIMPMRIYCTTLTCSKRHRVCLVAVTWLEQQHKSGYVDGCERWFSWFQQLASTWTGSVGFLLKGFVK